MLRMRVVDLGVGHDSERLNVIVESFMFATRDFQVRVRHSQRHDVVICDLRRVVRVHDEMCILQVIVENGIE